MADGLLLVLGCNDGTPLGSFDGITEGVKLGMADG